MKIITRALGPVQANCYVLINEGHALVIDPGNNFLELDEILEEAQASLDAILLTHAHFDHIAGVDSLLKRYEVDVYLNPFEFNFLNDELLNGSQAFFRHVICHAVPKPFKEDKMRIGHFDVEPIFCPGHSIGSTVLKIEENLFTGDVLFQGSIGRMDLETGSEYAMMKSLKLLSNLDKNYPVYPGHGPATTLDSERKWNPYLRF